MGKSIRIILTTVESLIMKYLIFVIFSLALLGCSEKTYFLACEGKTYSNYFDYKTGDEIKSKSKSFNDGMNLVVKKNLFGYSINNYSCKKDDYETLICGDSECFMDSAINFSKYPKCKEKFWIYLTFDFVSGRYDEWKFYSTKDKEYHIAQRDWMCEKSKKIIDD